MQEEKLMSKEELIELLKELDVPVSEGPPKDDNIEENERINFWDYIWEDLMASGENYNTIVTYQISIIANKPRSATLLKAKKKFNDKGYHPRIQHEHLIEQRRVHSFFSIDVLENIEVLENV